MLLNRVIEYAAAIKIIKDKGIIEIHEDCTSLNKQNTSLKKLRLGGPAILVIHARNQNKVKVGEALKIPELNSIDRLLEVVYIWLAPENSIEEHNPWLKIRRLAPKFLSWDLVKIALITRDMWATEVKAISFFISLSNTQ